MRGWHIFYRMKTEMVSETTLAVESCEQTGDLVDNNDDCDDSPTGGLIFPGQDEDCDGVDNDCNGKIDEGALPIFIDSDADGYGSQTTVEACEAPLGAADNDDDCDDTTVLAFPGNPELCDQIDNDCDLEVDEGMTIDYYQDSDGDGFGNPDQSLLYCGIPQGYVNNDEDCDDTTALAHPDQVEICDGIDNDCDNLTMKSCCLPFMWMLMEMVLATVQEATGACSSTEGRVANNDDCNDSAANAIPAPWKSAMIWTTIVTVTLI